jgi:histidinol-phosphate aminotransferase
MSIVSQLIRPEILALSAYHVPDSAGFVKLDAMENPYTLSVELQAELGHRLSNLELNRYPVPSYAVIKAAISRHFDVPGGFDLVLGNGSDELISMVSVACAKSGAKVLAPMPGFVMYAMSAKFAGMEFIGVPLQADFTLDISAMLSAIAEHRPAITYLAYPNNPTGTLYDAADIEAILRAVGESGIVIVDEAYQPFAQTSFMSRLPEFPNLVVMRTVSKLGLAGIRLGYMSCAKALLDEFEKVRPPYNINVLTEAAVICLLEHLPVFDAQATQLREQRTLLALQLSALPGVEVFPSSANFLLIRLSNSEKTDGYGDQVFAKLLEHKILVKNVGKMHYLLKNCLRITVSTPEENALFLDAIKISL